MMSDERLAEIRAALGSVFLNGCKEARELIQAVEHLMRDNRMLRFDLADAKRAVRRSNDPTVMTDAEVAQDIACEGA